MRLIHIRLGNLGNVYPIGDSHGQVQVGGREWELYIGMNGDMKVFSFIAPEQIQTFEQDIRPFFDHITDAHEFPAENQYLISTYEQQLLYEPLLL